MALAAVPLSTPVQTMEPLVHRIKEGSRAWVSMAPGERIHLLEELRRSYAAIAEPSVRAACEAKGIAPDSPTAGEEWLTGPFVVLRNLRLLVESLKDIQRHGVPYIPPSRLRTLDNGQLCARVYPVNTLDSMLLPRHEGEVRFLPGVTAANLREHQASFYRRPHEGRVCAVLGGGNINSIAPTDCLYKLFVEGTACVLKMNPVNAYLGPFLEQAFAPLARHHVFAVIYGGAEEGAVLVHHPEVDEVHITGSDKTHDALLWGPPGPESEARRVRNEPLLRKTLTSELGNISPIIIVPGPYSDGEVRFQAQQHRRHGGQQRLLQLQLRQAAGAAARLAPAGAGWWTRCRPRWAGRRVRRAWYPGAEQRWKQFTEGREGRAARGHARAGRAGLRPGAGRGPAETRGSSSVRSPGAPCSRETGLPGSDDPVASWSRRSRSSMTGCGGPSRHARGAPRVAEGSGGERRGGEATGELRYGTVAVNTWPAAVFGLGSRPGVATPPPRRRTSRAAWAGCTTPSCSRTSRRSSSAPHSSAFRRCPGCPATAGCGPWPAGWRTSSWDPPG